MRYVPKQIEGNDNVSRANPLVQLGWLLGGVLALLWALYLAAGLFGEALAVVAPAEVERAIGEAFIKGLPRQPADTQRSASVRELAERVREAAGYENPVEVLLVETNEANAYALPGGKIIVLTGLLEQAESENEIAFVLAHEIGHVAHRDAMRGLGRAIALTVAASLIMDSEEATSRFIGGALNLGQLRYSREQERGADAYALDAAIALYGHTGGAGDFFLRQSAKLKDLPGIPEFASTHPDPLERAENIAAASRERGCPQNEKTSKPAEWDKVK